MEEGGKTVYLVGTVHVSRGSMKRVEDSIRTVMPDMVCLELDAQRFRFMKNMWEGGHFRYSPGVEELLTLPGLLKWLQHEIGKEFGVMPGSEMRSAFRAARDYGLNVALIDRPVDVTFARMWGGMRFGERMRLLSYVLAAAGFFLLKPLLGKRVHSLAGMMGESRELDMGKLERGEGVDDLMDLLKQQFPGVHRALVEERNVYMCNNILRILESADTLVVVVGMGHSSGMKKLLESKGIKVIA